MSGSTSKFRSRKSAILEVPYEEKDEVKALGAWWDPDLKKWFVPYGKDVKPFTRWIANEKDGGASDQDKAANE